MEKDKQKSTGAYIAPGMAVLETEMSQVICLSGGIEDLNPYDPWVEGE